MAELTPAQECAVEVLVQAVKLDNPTIPDLPTERVIALYPVSFEIYSAIVSRYIREAEQRGREKCLDELAKAVMRAEEPHD